MSEKTARTYTHPSNRAKPRDGGERKPVFKGVLDSPYRIQWPSVPINLQNSALARIVSLLDDVSEYQQTRRKDSKKRKRDAASAGHAEGSKKKNKANDEERITESAAEDKETSNLDNPETDTAPQNLSSSADPSLQIARHAEIPCVQRPVASQHLVCGINEVTKRLEIQVRDARRPAILRAGMGGSVSRARPPLKTIFVCRADVDPPLLVDHIPHLVAAYNSVRVSEPIKLVPLPKGAESTLARAVGVRRVAILALDEDFPELQSLLSILEPVPTVTAPWLSGIESKQQLIPTHIKQVRTSAPKDIKAAKERRSKGKAAAKLSRSTKEKKLLS